MENNLPDELMKNRNINAKLYCIASMLFYMVAVMNFVKQDTFAGIFWLCLGTVWMCLGSVKKQRKSDE